MGIRRTYHFNAPGSARKDGIYIADPCDMHFRQYNNYPAVPYGLDSDGSNRLLIGDRASLRTNSSSLPAYIVGGHCGNIRTVSSADSAGIDDYIIDCNTAGGNFNLSLPAISTNPNKIIIVKNTGVNTLSIIPNGADTVEGLTQLDLLTLESVCLYSDSSTSKWFAFGRSPRLYGFNSTFGFGSPVSITGGSFATYWSTTRIFSGRPFLMFFTGSAWYNSTEFAQIEFGYNQDGGTDFVFMWHNTLQSQSHILFSSQTWMTNSTAGSHTLNIRARIKQGTTSNVLKLDSNDWLKWSILDF